MSKNESGPEVRCGGTEQSLTREEFNAKWPEEMPESGSWLVGKTPQYYKELWDRERAHALQEWEKQQPQPLAGGDAGFWDDWDERARSWRHGDYSHDRWGKVFHRDELIAEDCNSSAAQEAVEAHKAGREAPEPEAGFWVAEPKDPMGGWVDWKHKDYGFTQFDDGRLCGPYLNGDTFCEQPVVPQAATREAELEDFKQKAQRLVEQDMERRAVDKLDAQIEKNQDAFCRSMGIENPAKGTRPWDGRDIPEHERRDLRACTHADLNHLAARQDADAPRIAKLEKQVRWQDGQIDELKKRVGELPYAERLERMVVAMHSAGWADKTDSDLVAEAVAALAAVDAHLAQPQPASEPCGVVDEDWLELEIRDHLKAGGCDRHVAFAASIMCVYRAHIAERGEVAQ